MKARVYLDLMSRVRRKRRSSGLVRGLAAACLLSAVIPVRADAPADRYMTVVGQGLVTDLRTGLTWQQAPDPTVRTWMDAAAYCRGLYVGLSSGFRLPTMKEMLTLIDPTRVGPAVDVKVFPNVPAEWFWTASNRYAMGPGAVSVDTGASGFFAATDLLRVWCVR